MQIEVVDHVEDWVPGKRALASQNITMSNIIFDTHFPLKPVWPGMLSIMAMQRLAEGVLGSQDHFTTAYQLSSLSRIKWRYYVVPGDRMTVEVEVTGRSDQEIQVKGSIKVGSRMVVTVGQMSFQAIPSTTEIKQSMDAYWKLRGAREVILV